jgi:hypothetical protein
MRKVEVRQQTRKYRSGTRTPKLAAVPVNGRPPAEADMIRFFRVTPPTVHQMVLGLEKAGLISRKPGVARSIAVLLERSALPELNPRDAQPVKITVTGY